MKSVKILASTAIALASLAAGTSFAQSSYSPTLPGVPTTNERGYSADVPTGAEKSRAEVMSELAQAQAEADGALDDASERLTYNFEEVDSTKSRADVRGEVLQAKRSGSMALPGTARTPFGTTSPSFPRNTTVQTAGR